MDGGAAGGWCGGRVDLGTLYFVLDFAVFEPKSALKIKFINEFKKVIRKEHLQ